MKRNRFVKKITSWIRGGGLLFLSNISLVSVGFASWTIGGATSADAEIKVAVDGDIIDLNSYFTFDGVPTLFEYTSVGLVKDETVDSNNPVKDGYIQIPFQIDTKSGTISDHLASGSKGFELRTVLIDKNTGLDLFGTSVCSVTESLLAFKTTNDISSTDYLLSSTSISSVNKETSADFNLDDFSFISQSKVYFSVQYKLTFNVDDFKAEIFDKLTDGSFLFSFKAGGVF